MKFNFQDVCIFQKGKKLGVYEVQFSGCVHLLERDEVRSL